MPSIKVIKQRARSAKNIAQITKAMEVVSATKMRKAQEFALRARPYAVASLEMLQNLLSRTPVLPPLLQARPVKTSVLLVITSDKGLAGAFNANVLKKAEAWIQQKRLKSNFNQAYKLITVGKKARDYFDPVRGRPAEGTATGGTPIQQSFWGFGDYSTLEQTLPVAQTILDGYLFGAFDEVETVYASFKTTLQQEAVLKKVLPVTKEGIEEMVKGILPERGRYASVHESTNEHMNLRIQYHYEYKFEPSPAEILNVLIPQLLRMHIHHIILESNASEHSARMVAMKNASDNARELIGELTLEYNKSRQAGITRELTEITTGKETQEL